MAKAYWRKVAVLAWSQSLQTLRLTSSVGIVLTILTALVMVAVLLFWGSQDAAGDMILERGAIWAVAILAFPFVYGWHFMLMPAKMDEEKNNNIETLNGRLNVATVALKQQVVNRFNVLTLSILLEQGYVINIERISLDQFENWTNRLRAWEILALKYIATAFSHQDAVAFKNVHYHMKENFIFKISDEHNRELQQLTTRLKTLREIVNRHQGAWSPVSPVEREQIETYLVDLNSQISASDSDQTLNEAGS